MATYTDNTRALKPDTGSLTGTWGDAANANVFDVLDHALGFAAHTLTGTSETLTVSDGVVSTAGAGAIIFAGSPGGDATVTLAPSTLQKIWFIKNNTGDSSAVIMSQGSGSNVTIESGYSAVIYSDGGGASANVYNLLDSMEFTALGGSSVSVNEGDIDHDALLNFVADEHVAHSGVSITGGTGLTGGGTIAASRTIDLDINGLTVEATVDGAADYVAVYDASAGAHRKVLVDNLVAGGGAGSVASVAAGEGIANDGSASAVDLSIALEEISTAAFAGSDFLVSVTGAGVHKKQAISSVELGLFANSAGFLTSAVTSLAFGTLGTGLDGTISGSGAVTLDLSIDLTEYGLVTYTGLAAADQALFLDTSASSVPKRITVPNLVGGAFTLVGAATPVTGDYIPFWDVSANALKRADLTDFGGGGSPGNFTQHTGATLAFFSDTPVSQQSDPGSLTMIEISGSGDDLDINDNFSAIENSVNNIILYLQAYGLFA